MSFNFINLFMHQNPAMDVSMPSELSCHPFSFFSFNLGSIFSQLGLPTKIVQKFKVAPVADSILTPGKALQWRSITVQCVHHIRLCKTIKVG